MYKIRLQLLSSLEPEPPTVLEKHFGLQHRSVNNYLPPIKWPSLTHMQQQELSDEGGPGSICRMPSDHNKMTKEGGDCSPLPFNYLLICWLLLWQNIYNIKDFPNSSVGKESVCNAGDPGLIPGSGRSAGEGIGYPLQYSWASLVAQLVKNLPAKRPGFDPWAGKIPWRKERPPSPVFWPREFHVFMGLQRVGHDWATFTFTHNIKFTI